MFEISRKAIELIRELTREDEQTRAFFSIELLTPKPEKPPVR